MIVSCPHVTAQVFSATSNRRVLDDRTNLLQYLHQPSAVGLHDVGKLRVGLPRLFESLSPRMAAHIPMELYQTSARCSAANQPNAERQSSNKPVMSHHRTQRSSVPVSKVDVSAIHHLCRFSRSFRSIPCHGGNSYLFYTTIFTQTQRNPQPQTPTVPPCRRAEQGIPLLNY